MSGVAPQQHGQRPVEGAPKRRRRHRVLRVKVLPEEAEVIEKNAAAAGLTLSAYLRTVGQGMEPRAVADHDQVQELVQVNGDLGRLGGLLKLWLTDDEKLDAYSRKEAVKAVREALSRIEASQSEVQAAAKRILGAIDR